MIKISSSFSFSEIGGKDNQEDRVYPHPSSVGPDQRYFILCDGMGGHSHGEVASETVSTSLGQYFDSHPIEVADEAYFNSALEYAYSQLDKMDDGSEKKMGTTLTCLIFNPDGFLAAHIGDSRIYQFRGSDNVFRTEDHSLVNDLIKAGELTPEEAVNFPRKNVITRAMQPNSRRCKADVFISDDVCPGDCFFMCCDGVLERANEERLARVFGGHSSAKKKISEIKAECDKGTKDNYTSWLISIGDTVEGNHSRKLLRNLLMAGSLLLALAVGTVIGSSFSRKSSDDKSIRVEVDSLNHLVKVLERDNRRLSKEIDGLNKRNSDLSTKVESLKSARSE